MKTILRLLFVMIIAIAFIGAGEYQTHTGTKHLAVTTSVAGTDSTFGHGFWGLGPAFGFTSLHAQIIVGNATPVLRGIGEADSVMIKLFTSDYTGNIIIDSIYQASIPCTLNTVIHSNIGDSLLRNEINLEVWTADTLADSAFVATYPISYRVKLK